MSEQEPLYSLEDPGFPPCLNYEGHPYELIDVREAIGDPGGPVGIYRQSDLQEEDLVDPLDLTCTPQEAWSRS